MATIAEQLTELNNVKQDIKASIIAKGVSMDNVPFTDYASKIDEISAGAGSDNKLAQLVSGTIEEVTAEDLAGVASIRTYAFYYSSLTSIFIPDSVTSIGSYAFSSCSSLTSVTIGSGVTSIGSYAFSSCSSLTSVTIGSGVTSIGSSAFSGCSSLTSITIPDSVTSIGNWAFYNCSSLTSISIPEGVTSIGNYVFYNCTSLTSITILSNVTVIGSYALQIGSTTNKATITMLPTTPPNIQSNTFNAFFLNKIIVPKGYGETYKTATNWSNFADYIEEATE